MTYKHSFQILQTGSRYAGRKCPVTRTELKPGERFIVCHKNDGAFSWAALPDLGGQCPYCGQQIDLGQVLTPSGKAYPSKPAQPDKDKKRQPRPKPGYLPSPWRGGLSLPVIALIAILSLGLIGVCSAGAVLGYRQFLAQSTLAPTTGPIVAQATETPAAPEPTATSPSTVEAPEPTNVPLPTSTSRPAPTLVPSPTPCAIAIAPRFAAAWSQYADQLGCPVNQAHTHEAASQDFERGFLLWRVNPDQVYVMYDDGRLGFYPMSVYPESVRQNPPGGDPNIHPPTGFQQPVRGFGLVWRDNPEVRDGVGWAVEGEARADWYYGFEAQDFVGGVILHECRMGVRVLLSSGTWIKISEGDPCG